MSAESNKALVRRFVEFINKNNGAPVEGFDEFFAPGYTYHNPRMPEMTDLATVKQLNAMTASAFPDTRFTIEDMVAEGDKVVYRYSASGTHKGDFMGIAATGKQSTVTGIVISRIVDGKFKEDWEILDLLGFLQNIGVVPQLGLATR
jgi:steroid delta-isomerase-like uncharacterized protein